MSLRDVLNFTRQAAGAEIRFAVKMGVMRKNLMLSICGLLFVGCVTQHDMMLTRLPRQRISDDEAAKKIVIVTTKPQFVLEEDAYFKWVYLVIHDAQEDYKISWGTETNAFLPVSLSTNQTYTFTIGHSAYKDILIPELRKVLKAEQIIYDIEVCEVHHIKMENKKVKIAYGLLVREGKAPSLEEYKKLFPHHQEFVLGGCVVDSDSPKTEKIYVCLECKKAYQQWNAEHIQPKLTSCL